MKIAFIITSSEVGGAQTWVNQLKILFNDEYDIHLVISEPGWLTEQFDDEKIKIIPEIASLSKPWAAIKIARYLKEINADIVISSSANAGVYARLSRLLYKHKSIYVSHGWSCIYNGGKAKNILCGIEKWLSFITDTVLCISESDKLKAENIIGVSPKKISVIRNCISPLPKKIHVNELKRVLCVGRMTHPKRPDLIANVIANMPDVELEFIGGGPYLSKMKEQFSSYKNINFLGEVRDFSKFNEYDIFILCSESEGLPMSAIEAASAGLPLLMSDVGGCYELILNDSKGNSNGILFSNSEEDLKHCLSTMLSDYSKYYASSYENMHSFDIKNIAEKYKKLFEN